MIGAVEHDFDGVALEPGLVQQILEANAAPDGIAHRPDAPFDTGNVRLEQAAAIARALAHRRDFDLRELLAQLRERVARRPLDALARNAESPFAAIDHRDAGQVPAHEEGVVGRDDGAKVLGRRLEIGRPPGLLDERNLARQRRQALLAQRAVGKLGVSQGRRAADLSRQGASGTQCRQGAGAGHAADQPSPRDHDPAMLVHVRSSSPRRHTTVRRLGRLRFVAEVTQARAPASGRAPEGARRESGFRSAARQRAPPVSAWRTRSCSRPPRP